jgi:hypothetical protein
MKHWRPIVALLLGFMLAPGLRAQQQDLQMWVSAGFRADLSDKIRVSIEEEARYFENISRLDKLNSDLTLDYKLSNSVSIGVLYRLISNRNASGYYNLDHRFNLHLEYDRSVRAWTFGAQIKAEKTFDQFSGLNDKYLPNNYIRIKGEISRLMVDRKTEPYVNLEFWYKLPQGQTAFVDQYRLTMGLKYKADKNNRLNLFYRIQQEIQVKDPLFAHVLGAGYTFVWN